MTQTVVVTQPQIQTVLVDDRQVMVVDNTHVNIVTEGVQGPAGPGLPLGGATHQLLRKKTAADNDTEWANMTPGAVLFADAAGGMAEDAGNLFYTNASDTLTAKKLTVGTGQSGETPLASFDGDWSNLTQTYMPHTGRWLVSSDFDLGYGDAIQMLLGTPSSDLVSFADSTAGLISFFGFGATFAVCFMEGHSLFDFTTDRQASCIYSTIQNAGVPTPSNSVLGTYGFTGTTGAALGSGGGATIYGVATGNWTPTSSPAKIVLATTSPSTAVDSDRLIVHDNGVVETLGEAKIGGALNHDGSTVGFYAATPITKPAVTGSRGGNAALASLCTQLASLGLITNSTTA